MIFICSTTEWRDLSLPMLTSSRHINIVNVDGLCALPPSPGKLLMLLLASQVVICGPLDASNLKAATVGVHVTLSGWYCPARLFPGSGGNAWRNRKALMPEAPHSSSGCCPVTRSKDSAIINHQSLYLPLPIHLQYRQNDCCVESRWPYVCQLISSLPIPTIGSPHLSLPPSPPTDPCDRATDS